MNRNRGGGSGKAIPDITTLSLLPGCAKANEQLRRSIVPAMAEESGRGRRETAPRGPQHRHCMGLLSAVESRLTPFRFGGTQGRGNGKNPAPRSDRTLSG